MVPIVLVEDDGPLRFLIRHWIENRIYDAEVIEESTLLGAIKTIKNRRGEPIMMVLLDLNLSDYKGLNTLHILKKEFPHMPVVVITGGEVDVNEALEAGADDYLRKPFNEQDVYMACRDQMNVERIRAEVDRMRRLVGDIALEIKEQALERARR